MLTIKSLPFGRLPALRPTPSVKPHALLMPPARSGAAAYAIKAVRAVTWREDFLHVAEAVGIPATLAMATKVVRPGGNVVNIGEPVESPLNELWIRDIVISMRWVNTNTLGVLLRLVAEHKLPAE